MKEIRIESSSIFMQVNIGNGSFDILPKNGGKPSILNATCCVTGHTKEGKLFQIGLGGGGEWTESKIKDVHGKGRQIQINKNDPATGLELTVLINQYQDQPFILIRAEIRNNIHQEIHVDSFHLMRAEKSQGSQVQFESGRKPLDFFKVGWHDWVYSGLRHGNQHDVDSLFALKPFTGKMLYNPATPIGKRKGEFWGDGWGILTDQRDAIVAGLVSTADQFGLLQADCNPGRAGLTLTSMADGVVLDPGERLQSEWGYIQFVKLPVADPLADYVKAVARQMHPRAIKKSPGMQWTHWYYYFEHITEKEFLKNLEAADRLRDTIPYEIFQLDGGYYPHWGDWTETNERFPDGLEYLARQIKGKKMTPGLWLAPFVVDPRSKVAQAHPEWLVKEKNGKPILSGYFYDFYGNALDMTHPGAQDHIRAVLDKLVHTWGYGWIKTDFVYAGALPGVRQNPRMTRAQAFRKGMECVREGIGEKTYLLGCGCPMGPAIGIVDAIRVGPDTAPNWAPFLWNMKWATPLIKEERSIAALRNNVRQTLNMSALHRRWWWNDPDCLMVREDNTTLTREEVISNVSLMGLNGGLVIHSDDLTKLTPEHIQFASLLTPLIGGDGRAMDLLQNEMAELYVLPQSKPWGMWWDVATFNWQDKEADRTLDIESLGIKKGTPVHVFDFWQKEYSLCKTPQLVFKKIPRHGCKLLRICVAEKEAEIVGDTLHISMGGEIATWKATGKSARLEIINLGRKASGKILFRLAFEPKKVICNKKLIAAKKIMDRVYEVELSFEGKAIIDIR